MGTPKNILSLRISPETLARVQVLVDQQGLQPGYRGQASVKPTVSSFISDLLDAVTERRVVVLAEPIPHYINDGSDPDLPILVAEDHHAT